MKRFFIGTTVALLVLAFFNIHAASLLAAPSQTWIADEFARKVNNSWGQADQGGRYSLSGDPADFDVNGSEATILGETPQARGAYLSSVSALNSSTRIRVKTDKLAAGGTQNVFLIARRNRQGDSYMARLILPANGIVSVQALRRVAGKNTRLAAPVQVGNVRHTVGAYIYLRLQVSGTNPTTIQVRAWAAGDAEPTNPAYRGTDATASLQQAGTFGVQVSTTRAVTNLPYRFTFDDFTSEDVSSTPPPAGRIYWGALVNGAAPSPGNLAATGVFSKFEANAGKKMAILHWGQPWKMGGNYQPFQASYFTAVRNRGSIPFLDWSSMNLESGIDQPKFKLSAIANGDHDAYITQWAKDAKAWGHPFFMRFDWEMNGYWQFPWSEQLNGNQPGDYVKMWRHVHDIFAQQGTHNVTWVWCPNIASATTTPLSTLYPGDAYVDWTCLDGYNKYPTWLEFEQVFAATGINWLHNSYHEITTLAPTKPLVIGEVASLEAGDGGPKKAAWIKNAFQTQLPARYPKIKAVLWFNWDDRNPALSFPIESSQAAKQAFANSIHSSYYATNEFSTLDVSPIPPLP